jgi:hypothetical protein
MGVKHRMFENEYGQDEESTGMKQLRQALDKANAALKVREEELGKLQGQVRTQSVREILRDLGVKPKVAGLIPSDLDPTPEAVEKWVKDYEDVFGSALRAEEKPKDSESEAAPVTPAQSSVDAATQQALGRVQTAEASAGVVPPDIEQAQLAALAAIGQEAGNDSRKLLNILQGRA